MTPNNFFTRSSNLAFLRNLVVENSNLSYDQNNVKFFFEAVDAYYADHLPGEGRGGWFPPLMVGGAHLSHIPPHIVFAIAGILADLRTGSVEPVPFLFAPLNLDGATAAKFEPTDQYLVMDKDRLAAPLTDLLIIAPSTVPKELILDYYGITQLNAGTTAISWHAAAESHFSAMNSGIIFLHHESNTVLNPMLPYTHEVGRLFFGEGADLPRLERHLDRLEEFLGIPRDVMTFNHETARRVVEAYLKKI